MDILKILKENKDELLDADIECLVTELETGDYDEEYIKECRAIIMSIQEGKVEVNNNQFLCNLHKAKVDQSVLNPNYVKKEETLEEIIWNKINDIRKKENAQLIFKQYLEENSMLTEEFIDTYFSKFIDIELKTILETTNLSESFLEKHFGQLNKDLISHYQCFSEEFFMKHFKDLQVNTVLTKGPNPWKSKENRSSKLNVFLKLKGVNL